MSKKNTRTISIRLRLDRELERQVADIYELLKGEAKQLGISVNELMCKVIREGFVQYMAGKMIVHQLKQLKNMTQENLDK